METTELKPKVPLCIITDDPMRAIKIFEELNLQNEFVLVPNDFAIKDSPKTSYFEAILLANK